MSSDNTQTEPGVPASFDRPGLSAAGYIGWRTWTQLRKTACAEIPQAPGCYAIVLRTRTPPSFLPVSPAGHYNAKDPTVSLDRLTNEWVPDADVVYLGKANQLRTRLKTYARFGAGEPVAHWGGRLIWQLETAHELLVAWHPLTTPGTARELEQRLLIAFALTHNGRRPMANLTG